MTDRAATFVIGHKNPDSDSVCSAYALAALRNITDPKGSYLPVRCGNINTQTKFIFDYAGAEIPPLQKDVYPKVSDVMTEDIVSVHIDAPMIKALAALAAAQIQSIPIVDGENRLMGVVGERELINLFIQQDVDKRPIYHFNARHIPEVIKGSVLHNGKNAEFKAAIMVGSMPKGSSIEHIEMAGAHRTILVTGNRPGVINFAIKSDLPAIVITGINSAERSAEIKSDFSGYKGWVYLSSLDSAETIRRLILASPVRNIMNTFNLDAKSNVAAVGTGDYLDKARELILNSRQRLLPVIDSNGFLLGIVTRSNILTRFKHRIIMVDHNEPSQAADGIETAEVVEIVDHHRLGAVKTDMPLTYYSKPVGSTCTLVYELYQSAGITPSATVGKLLLCGILSDTVMLKSPTAATADRNAIEELAELLGEDWKEVGKGVFAATDSLSARTPENIITADFKIYDEFGVKFGVGQAETVTLTDLDDVKAILLEELDRQKEKRRLDWAMLMITDIVLEESILLCTQFDRGEHLFSYHLLSPHSFHLPGVLSRKKQLLPEILRILEEI
ncbi:MAG: putative manganese-dependent inorganic diphosphatase [Deferribacteraceae bacterium]|jgi:manganese-dependent inorganic pyrophosphatase|nr:putative manganese-dependent inorganic diphosphatase [Deferribacteraceae bacterium]